MDDSILDTIKKLLGADTTTDFDIDILVHINSVVGILKQLGYGPTEGFEVTKTTTWSEYLQNKSDLNQIKTYMYLKVKSLFDPPQSGFLTDSMNNIIKEFEWRINVLVDTKEPVEEGTS